MPATPIIGNVGSKKCIQLVLKNTIVGASKPVSAVFYYKRTSAGTADNKVALAAAFLAGPYAALLAAWNIAVGDGVAWIRYIDDATDGWTLVPLAGVGAIATDRTTTFNAVYMQLLTGFRGATYKGSKKFYGVNEIDTTHDLLTGAGLARWQAVAVAIAANLTATGETYAPSVLSFNPPTQIQTNPTNVAMNVITSIVLNLNVGTMKRRKHIRQV